jgi:cell wall-associated NlpC family hydrolase
MQKAYYESDIHAAALEIEARRWMNTPFHKRACVPGLRGGVDCFGLLAAMNHATGITPPLDMSTVPDYNADWSAHHEESLLEPWLLRFLDEARIGWVRIDDFSTVQIGDVLLFAPARSIHHLGQVINDGWFVHAMMPAGVTIHRVDHPRFRSYFRYAIRLLETVS